MKPITFLLAGLVLVLPCKSGHAESIAANAINSLGIDLLQKTARPDGNALLSPYSIQLAMAMTCAGADGQTRKEMARVLHYPKNQADVDTAFAALQADLADVMKRQAEQAAASQRYGITNTPLTLTTANRIFGQTGYDFRPAYLDLLKNTYLAPMETWDFFHNAAGATTHINHWVEQQTHDRIQNLIPPGALSKVTRLVLVNAIYLKAAWEQKFKKEATQPQNFYLSNGTTTQTPTMFLHHSLGYAHHDGYSMVVLPYNGGDLQFVILLPDARNGLAGLAARLKPKMLTDSATLPQQDVALFLPKFKLEPPALLLGGTFRSMGMKTAFDIPHGSANFDLMAPRRPDDYLYVSEIIHKTWLKLDESGTEAAAATAVVMVGSMARMEPVAPPVQIRVDHPFLFAIQHRESGACLFLGQVTDPQGSN